MLFRTEYMLNKFIATGVVTGILWQAAIGLWTHVLLYRCPASGLLEEVYGFSPPPGVDQCPSAEACCEMLLLLVFAPLLVTDIRAPVSTSISAVDASPWACASVAAELSERAVRELWRFRDWRGGYVLCETDFEAFVHDVIASDDEDAHRAVEAAFADEGEAVPDLSEHERQFSWVSELADGVGWRPIFRYRAPVSEHINRKEGRAYRTLVRRKAFDAEAHGTRQLVLEYYPMYYPPESIESKNADLYRYCSRLPGSSHG